MIRGYSDTGKQPISDKIRMAIRMCQEDHDCTPVEIQCNADDIGELKDVDGIPLTTVGRLVVNRNIFMLKLPASE